MAWVRGLMCKRVPVGVLEGSFGKSWKLFECGSLTVRLSFNESHLGVSGGAIEMIVAINLGHTIWHYDIFNIA